MHLARGNALQVWVVLCVFRVEAVNFRLAVLELRARCFCPVASVCPSLKEAGTWGDHFRDGSGKWSGGILSPCVF